jgi:hypothetical protein
VATRLPPLAPRVISKESREVKSQQGFLQWVHASTSSKQGSVRGFMPQPPALRGCEARCLKEKQLCRPRPSRNRCARSMHRITMAHTIRCRVDLT